MRVRNFYTLSPKELGTAIQELREWLFDYPHHEKYKVGVFALDVALSANELERDEDIDRFIKYLI